MGSGKSSVGRELARLLNCPAIDLDAEIERQAGRTVPEIFSAEGEETFRALELTALRQILDQYGEDDETDEEIAKDFNDGDDDGAEIDDLNAPHLILSLGGGTLTTPKCAALVHQRTICLYLRATTDTLIANLHNDSSGRPMLSGGIPLRERIEQLMRQRAAVYERVAHYIVDIDGKTPKSVARDISLILRKP
ncbi:MAG: hypothetical protein LUC24_00135 [Bacteroidales bacterium]|nr:hypothetical protein [Bacteroidales bacterium]